MDIDKEMYGAIGAVLGAILGAMITLYGSVQNRKIEMMKKHIKYLCDQLSSYYELERIYSEEISSLRSEKISAVRVKVLMRDLVETTTSLARPGITRSKIRSILQD